MLESNIMYNWPDVMMQCTVMEEDASHVPNIFASYRLYECTDGWVTIACGTDRQWQSFCAVLEDTTYIEDERFKSAADRGANIAAFFDATADIASRFDVDTVVTRLRDADVPVAPVLAPEDVKSDPQVAARAFIEEREHPVVGRFLGPKHPASMFGEDLALSPAPRLGEQTREILGELGYADDAISDLLAAGVVRTLPVE